jgi:hypothetical protein
MASCIETGLEEKVFSKAKPVYHASLGGSLTDLQPVINS